MAQLKMYWLKGTPIREMHLPEGFSISRYSCDEDMQEWIACCKDGLIAEGVKGEDRFANTILKHKDLNLYEDVLFLDCGGEHVATAAAIYHPEKNCGELHMVGMKTEWRGKGLVKYLNNAAVRILSEKGVDYIYLTTDEWRKGAVKSYLTEGFVPVKYDRGMKKRWRKVLAEYNIDSVDMVREDCSFYKTIHPVRPLFSKKK